MPAPASPEGGPRAVPETTRACGMRAEGLASAWLVAHGYRPVTANFHAAGGEVDLIAWHGEVLCFVEVRARTDVRRGHPLETIDRRKQARIARAAAAYAATLPSPWPAMRFDALGIVLARPPVFTLVRAAFERGA